MNFSTVLFDFDGTVFDTVEGISKSVQYAIRKHGMDAQLSELRCFAGPPLVDMFMEKFGVDEAFARQLTTDFRERYNPIGLYECRVFPGVRELAEKLRAAGKQVGIATSKPTRLARTLLEREGMLDLFDVISGAGDNGEGNAKSQVIRKAMEALGAEQDGTVLIGDTKYDVFGANQAGIRCIGVSYGYALPGEMEAAGALCMVPDCEALANLLLTNH